MYLYVLFKAHSNMNKSRMLSSRISVLYLLIISFLSITLVSCYPASYQTPQKMTSRVEQRNEAIRKVVRKELKVGERYIDYGFGSEKIVKPTSFQRLDSLYAVYYEEEQKPGASRNALLNLKNEIELEKVKVQGDTIHFQYEKEHFFGFSSGDSTTIMLSKFLLDAQYTVIYVDIQYIFTVHSRLTQYFQSYVRRESFVDFGYLPSNEESDFYNFFDGMAALITNAETKGNFIGHTLHIMRAANQQRGLLTEPLIKQHIINIVTGSAKEYKPLKWSQIYTNLDENDGLISYEVDHEWSYKDPFNIMHEMRRTFVLNPYFEITEVLETSKLRD